MNNLDEIITNKVRELLERREITSYKLGKAIGENTAKMSGFMNNKVRWKAEVINSIADYFKVSVDWLYGKEEKKELYISDNNMYGKKFKELPLLASIPCGIPVEQFIQDADSSIIFPDINHLRNPFAVRATGDSMAQTIVQGDILCAYESSTMIKDKSVVLVSYKTNPETSKAQIKRLHYNSNDTFTLYSDNSRNHPPEVCNKKDVYKIYSIYKKIIRTLLNQ